MKQKMGRKLYSVPEIYGIAVNAYRSLGDLHRLQKSDILTSPMQERVMLAVTSVNTCAMCSSAHAAKAVLFGQYYAERRAKPEREVWNELVSTYGQDLAQGILASARIIMMGNALGIVLGSISGRFHGKGGDPRSSIPYELAVVLTVLPILILAAVQAAFLSLFRVPKI